MYCSKCGVQLPEDSQFCSNCGKMVGDNASAKYQVALPAILRTNILPDNKRDIAFFLSVFTSPFLFIVRIFTQKESTGIPNGGWKYVTTHYVPDNIKTFMAIILFTSILVSLILVFMSKNPDKRRNKPTMILSAVNVIVGLILLSRF